MTIEESFSAAVKDANPAMTCPMCRRGQHCEESERIKTFNEAFNQVVGDDLRRLDRGEQTRFTARIPYASESPRVRWIDEELEKRKLREYNDPKNMYVAGDGRRGGR